MEKASVNPVIEVVLREQPVALSTELESWLLSIKAKVGTRILQNLSADTDALDHYIEFAEIKELPGAFMACSFYQKDINDALTRAGLYMGAGKGMKAGTLVGHQDFALINYKKLVAGHNLPGSVIRDFYASVEGSSDAQMKSNAAEQSVFEKFVKSSRVDRLNGDFYLIGFSIQSTKDQKGVISHEVFHAYSFLNSSYRAVVLGFWREDVSTEDKAAITKEIGLAYNVDDEELVMDEFQAYLLQSRAESDRMEAFVPKYRSLFAQRLSRAKIEIVKV